MNLSMLQDIVDGYAYEADMPFIKGEIELYLEEILNLTNDKYKDEAPTGFISSVEIMLAFLADRSVRLSEVGMEREDLVLTFTSGSTKKACQLRLGLNLYKNYSGNVGLSFVFPKGHKSEFIVDKNVTKEFGDAVLCHCANHNIAIKKYNRAIENKEYKKPWVNGGKLRNMDFLLQYDNSPEVDMLKRFSALLNEPENMSIVGNLSGDPHAIKDALEKGEATAAVAADIVGGVLVEDKTIGLSVSLDILNTLYSQIQSTHGSLASLRPIMGMDNLHDRSKLICIPDVMITYLKGATAPEVEHTIAMLSRKGFTYNQLSEDVYSAMQSALLSALNVEDEQVEQSGAPRKRLSI